MFLTIEETAALLKLSPGTVRSYARNGIIPARKIGKHWRFLEADILAAGVPNAAIRSVKKAAVPDPSRIAAIARNVRNRMRR